MFSRPGIKSIAIAVVLCAGSAAVQGAKGQDSNSADAGKAVRSPGAAGDPFIGKWKLNPSRSSLNDEMKVSNAGENKYAFDFGSGKPEIIVADGTDQPGQFGTTLAITVEGADRLKVVRKMDGRTLISAQWELSDNGNILTDHYTSFKADGSSNTSNYVYKRTAGDTGFAGTWESTIEQPAFELQIQPYAGDGLSFINSAQQSTRSIKFDGKDYPAVGPNFPAGFSASGRRVDVRSLQVTDKIGGQAFDTQDTALSPDGKTLTMTVHLPSQSKPKIYVFDRE